MSISLLWSLSGNLNAEDRFEETARQLLTTSERSQFRLSPDGRFLAMVETTEGSSALLIKGLNGGEAQRIDLEKPIRLKGFDWSRDSKKLVYFASEPKAGSDSSGALWLYSMAKKETKAVVLPKLKAKKSDESATTIKYFWMDFFRENRALGLLMTTTQDQLYTYGYDWSKRGKGQLIDVLEDDAISVYRAPKDGSARVQVNSKLIDNVFKTAKRKVLNDDRLLYRLSPKDAWAELSDFRTKVGRVEDVYGNRYPVGLSYSGDALYYVSGGENGTRAIHVYDLKNGLEKEKVYETAAFDSIVIKNESGFYGSGSDLVYSQKGKKEVGLVVNLGYEAVVWLDPEFKRIQSSVDKLLEGRTNVITDWDDQEQRFLISSWSPVDEERFYLFDLVGSELIEVGSRFPALTGWNWGHTDTVRLSRRDGSHLIAYLELPAGKQASEVPIILDLSRRLDATVGLKRKLRHDYLLAQGYGILRMPLSGSPGQGRFQFERGYGRNWEPMVEDIEDAVRYLIDEKQVDRRNLYLYAAMNSCAPGLLAMKRNPTLFKKAFLENPELEIDRILERRSGAGNKLLVTRWNGYAMLLPETTDGVIDYKALNVVPELSSFESEVFIFENPKGPYRNLKQGELLQARLKGLGVPVQSMRSEDEISRLACLGRFFNHD